MSLIRSFLIKLNLEDNLKMFRLEEDLKAVLRSSWIALPMLQSKFYWNQAISLLSRVGWWLVGWWLRIKIKTNSVQFKLPVYTELGNINYSRRKHSLQCNFKKLVLISILGYSTLSMKCNLDKLIPTSKLTQKIE